MHSDATDAVYLVVLLRILYSLRTDLSCELHTLHDGMQRQGRTDQRVESGD